VGLTDSPYAGRLGVNKTLPNMQGSFWWQGVFSAINGYIRTCVGCQCSKFSPVKPSGLLQGDNAGDSHGCRPNADAGLQKLQQLPGQGQRPWQEAWAAQQIANK